MEKNEEEENFWLNPEFKVRNDVLTGKRTLFSLYLGQD